MRAATGKTDEAFIALRMVLGLLSGGDLFPEYITI